CSSSGTWASQTTSPVFGSTVPPTPPAWRNADRRQAALIDTEPLALCLPIPRLSDLSGQTPSSSPAQDNALSRHERGFESRWGRTLSPTVAPVSLSGSKTGSKRSRFSVENGVRRGRFLRPQFRDPSGYFADLQLRD